MRENKKVKNSDFFACILDSNMLKVFHNYEEEYFLVVMNIRNITAPLNVCAVGFNI